MQSPTFVLVHGAWHTGSCWAQVEARLRAADAQVHAPSLVSHGDGVPYTEVTTIEQYAQPVRDAIESSDGRVVLVGHSLGGSALNYLAEVATERLAGLVYVTAAMIPHGKSANDYLFSPQFREHRDAQDLFAAIAPTEDGLGIRLDHEQPEAITAAWYGDCSREVVARALSQLTTHTPMIGFSSVSTITDKRFGSLPRLFVEARSDHGIPISIQRWLQRDVPGAEVRSLDTSHSPFLSRPDDLSAILLEFASASHIR